MGIFFYGGKAGKQEQRFAEKLLERRWLSEMNILPGGCELNSSVSLKLRCGDLIILCAASDESLNALLAIHDKFENFRIILILPDQKDGLIEKSHLLRPRYMTYMKNDLNELDTVVEKMILSGVTKNCSRDDKRGRSDDNNN